VLAGSFMDYAMPRADDFCAVVIEDNPVPTPTNPLGVKGAGEAGTVGSLSAGVNAIVDALSVLGIRHIDTPCTPYRVWQAIAGACSGEVDAGSPTRTCADERIGFPHGRRDMPLHACAACMSYATSWGAPPVSSGACSVPAESEHPPASFIWRMILSANRRPSSDQVRGQASPEHALKRDDFPSDRHHALAHCLSMIFSENRYPLFGIMR
jgi:hypothetical protein